MVTDWATYLVVKVAVDNAATVAVPLSEKLPGLEATAVQLKSTEKAFMLVTVHLWQTASLGVFTHFTDKPRS